MALSKKLYPDDIDRKTFDDVLARYPGVVPEKIRALDHKRRHDITEAVKKRKDSGSAEITRDEVLTLVEWKLSHGTYRPRLLSLVQSNPAPFLTTTICAGLAPPPDNEWSTQTVISRLKTLTELKGIGPATASLLLATAYPDEIPFFSDELFRWLHFGSHDEVKGSKAVKCAGWAKEIKYSIKEYEALLERCNEVRQRLGVGARDLEDVAFVLGREARNGGAVKRKGEGKERDGDDEGERGSEGRQSGGKGQEEDDQGSAKKRPRRK